ncbi:SPT2 chromatin protein [[Candida] zeylanoides]
MSLSNILEQVRRKGQVPTDAARRADGAAPPPARAAAASPAAQSVAPAVRSAPTSSRPVDPVVARLKAARKAEMERKEQARRARMGAPAKKKLAPTVPLRGPPAGAARAPRAPRTAPPPRGTAPAPAPVAPAAVKKMKFNDLMKKASQIDNSKLSISLKPRTKSPEGRAVSAGGGAARHAGSAPTARREAPSALLARREVPPAPARRRDAPSAPEPARATAPLPIRKPSASLSQKLSSRTGQKRPPRVGGGAGAASDSEDSFIASDDEEEHAAADYDRDEIWAIFNRGKKRQRFEDDYNSDDMEATGAEILEEEMRSRRRAELEDRREWEEEQRRAAEKRKRKRTP